jgi:hypothetical protein
LARIIDHRDRSVKADPRDPVKRQQNLRLRDQFFEGCKIVVIDSGSTTRDGIVSPRLAA